MIWKAGKELAQIMMNGKMLASLYRGGRLIWLAVRSCFGSGVWRAEKPWLDNEKWKSQK